MASLCLHAKTVRHIAPSMLDLVKYIMKKGIIATVLVLLGLAFGYRARKPDVAPATPAVTAEEAHQSFLYGRITTVDGVTYEGRLRWGSGEEAFWGNYFNGAKKANPWVAHVPPERLPKERRPIEIFGL